MKLTTKRGTFVTGQLTDEAAQLVIAKIEEIDSTSYRLSDTFVLEEDGKTWELDLRVDMAAPLERVGEHGGVPTPHLQITQAKKDGRNQKLDDTIGVTSEEIVHLLKNKTLPHSLRSKVMELCSEHARALVERLAVRSGTVTNQVDPFEGGLFD